MAYIDPHIIRTLFNELKKSINELYSKNTNLDMVPVLRNSSKVEYFLDGNFEYLWFMEMEENSKLKALLEEKEDPYADMPPLINPDDLESGMPSPINPEDFDSNIPPLIPEDNIIWHSEMPPSAWNNSQSLK
jgi:hypothetical protein